MLLSDYHSQQLYSAPMSSQTPVEGSAMYEIPSFVRGQHAHTKTTRAQGLGKIRREPDNPRVKCAVAMTRYNCQCGAYSVQPCSNFVCISDKRL